MRSETPEIALELSLQASRPVRPGQAAAPPSRARSPSLQPWRAFKPDGVIMFSDILTPLPALGCAPAPPTPRSGRSPAPPPPPLRSIEFDVVKGKGPVIPVPITTMAQVRALRPLEDADKALPFVRPVLQALRAEVGAASTVLGFVGTPWTLAAYSIEGGGSKECAVAKRLMFSDPATLHALLQHLTDALAVYIIHQIDSGAQVVQLFDSWAHHLSPAQFQTFSLPYAEKVLAAVRAARPGVPLIFHANGSAGKEAEMTASSADVLGFDWGSEMARARQLFGKNRVLQGNVDPQVLLGGNEAAIRREVERCCAAVGPGHHILNVGHGVPQGTPEANVALFCQLAREATYKVAH